MRRLLGAPRPSALAGPCCVAGAVSGKVRAWQASPSFAPAASVGRGLTLRCTRPATAGFASLRRRVNSNVRPHGVLQMFATFATAAAIVGIFAGVFAGRDGTRFFVGLAYALGLVVATVTVILTSTALFAGDS